MLENGHKSLQSNNILLLLCEDLLRLNNAGDDIFYKLVES